MKTFLLLSLFLLLPVASVHAQEALQPYESLSKSIQVEDQGDWILIHLQTMAGMKGPRIIRTQVRGPQPYTGDEREKRVVFEYFFIQDLPHSLRTGESVIITWKVMKTDWTAWNKNKQLYVLKQNDVSLTQEEIDLIKNQW
jgi:hypothetical protein